MAKKRAKAAPKQSAKLAELEANAIAAIGGSADDSEEEFSPEWAASYLIERIDLDEADELLAELAGGGFQDEITCLLRHNRIAACGDFLTRLGMKLSKQNAKKKR